MNGGGRVEDSDLDWIAEDHYRMLSLAFTVRSAEKRFAERLSWHLAPFRRPEPEVQALPVDMFVQGKDLGADRPLYSLFLANELRYAERDVDEVLAYAVWMLHAEISAQVRDLLLIHAGAVAREGAAILLPGKAGSGKSTLVLALLRRGFAYLSDELGAIDPVTRRIYPFEKRIGLDHAALAHFGDLETHLQDQAAPELDTEKRHVRPEDVGARVSGPVEPRSIVFLSDDRSGPPRLTPVPRAETVMRLAENSTNLYRFGERGVILLADIVQMTQAYALTGGSSIERAECLDERLTSGER